MQNDLFEITDVVGFESGDISDRFLRQAHDHGTVSCDLETSGLDWKSERIGLVQIFCPGHEVVVFKPLHGKRPQRFLALIENASVKKIFHHAMFDLRFIVHHWRVSPENIACTKIASKLLSPERQNHSLSILLQEYLGVVVDKSHQKSDWLSWNLSDLQIAYAKADVTSLPDLLNILLTQLNELHRADLAEDCFMHLPTRVALETGGFGDVYAY